VSRLQGKKGRAPDLSALALSDDDFKGVDPSQPLEFRVPKPENVRGLALPVRGGWDLTTPPVQSWRPW
jgi:hypothetical protein